MRKLTFGTEQLDKDRFDILYGGLCVSPRGVGKMELGTFASLVEKFQEIGKEIAGVDKNAICRHELGDDGGEIILEEEEFNLLNNMHSEVKWRGSTIPVMANEAYKWLDGIEKFKLKALKDAEQSE